MVYTYSDPWKVYDRGVPRAGRVRRRHRPVAADAARHWASLALATSPELVPIVFAEGHPPDSEYSSARVPGVGWSVLGYVCQVPPSIEG